MMYPLLKRGGHYACVWGVPLSFSQFHFESLFFSRSFLFLLFRSGVWDSYVSSCIVLNITLFSFVMAD